MMVNDRWLKIGDVARRLGVPKHVVRYWQSEFGNAVGRSVPRGRGGQRCFPPDAVLALIEVQRLLRVELYTIAGAKRQLRLAAERERKTG